MIFFFPDRNCDSFSDCVSDSHLHIVALCACNEVLQIVCLFFFPLSTAEVIGAINILQFLSQIFISCSSICRS